MTPMREARGSKSRGRDLRHSGAAASRGRLGTWLPTLLVVAILLAAVGAHRFAWGERYLPWLVADDAGPTEVAAPAGLDLPAWSAPAPDAVAVDPAGTVVPDRVAAALSGPLDDPDLGRHVVGAVGSLTPGSPTWTTREVTYVPASTTKLLTIGAALEVLGPEHTFTTRVVRGAGPREVVLVGGGDPLLASRPPTVPEDAATYPERADVTTLALQVADALGGAGRVRVRYDDSLFTGPTDNPAWEPDYVPDDVVSPITALMVDGGDEADGESRSDDPSLAAARAFAAALGDAGLDVAGQPRPADAAPAADAEQLAAVDSAPLAEIAERVLDVSDNEGAEVLAHQVGLATSGTGSFEAGATGVLETLASMGVDVTGDTLLDGSGLSRRNRVTTTTLLALLQHAAGPDGTRVRSLVSGLPVAGFTGSLTYRFADAPVRARGVVRAKTGTLTGVHALAGIAVDRDGVPLAFVLGADRSPADRGLAAQEALDRAAAALAGCRCTTG